MSSQLLLILDDASGQFNYTGGQWTLSTLVEWYNGTSYYPGFADGTHFGSFSLTFEGTSIAFIGNTPTAAFSQTATVAIDGGQPYNITYGDPTPPSYIQWYQSPTLADGTHTISVGHLDGTAVDVALIGVGSQTVLSGRRIFVDDNNSEINYTGSWTRNTNKFMAGTLPDGYPAGNSTHISSNPGDTITFRFSGSSPSVYGIFSWANLGLLSATYSLDGNVLPESISVTTSTFEYINDYGEASNFLLFSDNTIQPGDHTLVINITQCINQTFMFDYITYIPSFVTLATMPNLTTSAANASTNATYSASTTGTYATAVTSQVNNSGNHKSSPTGAIVGGVVGGLAAIAILCFLFVWLRKRRGNENDSQKNLTPARTERVHILPEMDQQARFSPLRYQDITTSTTMNSNRTLSPFQLSFNNQHGSSAADLKRERADFENQQRNVAESPLNSGDPLRSYSNSNRASQAEPPSYDTLQPNHPYRRAAETV